MFGGIRDSPVGQGEGRGGSDTCGASTPRHNQLGVLAADAGVIRLPPLSQRFIDGRIKLGVIREVRAGPLVCGILTHIRSPPEKHIIHTQRQGASMGAISNMRNLCSLYVWLCMSRVSVTHTHQD